MSDSYEEISKELTQLRELVYSINTDTAIQNRLWNSAKRNIKHTYKLTQEELDYVMEAL